MFNCSIAPIVAIISARSAWPAEKRTPNIYLPTYLPASTYLPTHLFYTRDRPSACRQEAREITVGDRNVFARRCTGRPSEKPTLRRGRRERGDPIPQAGVKHGAHTVYSVMMQLLHMQCVNFFLKTLILYPLVYATPLFTKYSPPSDDLCQKKKKKTASPTIVRFFNFHANFQKTCPKIPQRFYSTRRSTLPARVPFGLRNIRNVQLEWQRLTAGA